MHFPHRILQILPFQECSSASLCLCLWLHTNMYGHLRTGHLRTGHLRTEHLWPQRNESMFAKSLQFLFLLSVLDVASFGLFELHYCTCSTTCYLIMSFIFFRKENSHRNLHLCINRLLSTFCTRFFLIFKIISHIQHR